MNNKYKSYKNINLLEEEDFIRDMLNRTPARDDYWDELVEYDLLSHKELEEARNFMEAIRKPGTILSAREKDELWHNIESENRKNRNSRAKRRHLFYLLSTAATITLLISVYLFYPVLPDNSEPDLLAIVQNMEPVLNEPTGIQVITSGQETFVVDQHSADILLDEKGQLKVNSDVLIKKNTDTPKDKINYNQLITPKGTRSRLTLPDGTALHINSGSHVVFPEKFADHQREIFVNGEVFLEVAPDTKCPFLIHTKNMTVTVTGTSLNISAYESETQSVVLVSGAVTVKTAGKKEIPLLPNQMLSHTENTTSVTEVEVADYICWKEGYLQRNEDNLPSLMKKISRFYGKTITCDPLLLNQQGTGKLDLKEDFEQLLNGLKEIFPIEIVKGDESYHIRHSN